MFKKLLSIFKFDIPPRMGRLQYLFTMLQLILVLIILSIVFLFITNTYFMWGGQIVILVVSTLINIHCKISRLHDLNMSGWWLVLILPIASILPISLPVDLFSYGIGMSLKYTMCLGDLALFLLLPGTNGVNKFGIPGNKT